MEPIVLVGEIDDPLADLRWWQKATPAARLSGVESARRDWEKLRGRHKGMARMEGTNRDYEELLKLLNQHGARYLIVGGYAVSWHAAPRFTKDIDILVEPTLENAEKVLRALDEFIGPLGIVPEKLVNPRALVMLGVPPTRVDVLTSVDGVDFAQAWERRAKGSYGETPVCFLGLDDLMASKRAAGRPQDVIDLERLERLKQVLDEGG